MTGKKLLVADDSLTIQKVIRLALSNEGYEIQTVSEGNDAIEQIAVFRPDLILIDVSLPGQSAFEVKRAINQHQDLSFIRFILMSSAFETVDEFQVSEVQFQGRLTKPFDPAHLRKTLTEALASEPTSIPMSEESPNVHASDSLSAWTIPPPPPPIDRMVNYANEERAYTSSVIDGEMNQGMADLTDSIEPENLPLVASEPPRETVSELWSPQQDLLSQGSPFDSHSELIKSPPSFENQPNPFPSNEASSLDFSELTRTTFHSAGHDLDEHENSQWSVNEPKVTDIPLPKEQVEAMIRSQIQAMLEKMVEKILPEVTERIVKQEIHKLLAE